VEFHSWEPGRLKRLQNITNKQFSLVLSWNAACIGDLSGGIPSYLRGGIARFIPTQGSKVSRISAFQEQSL
jgi:hypothetical protein